MESPTASKQQRFRKRIPLGTTVIVGDSQKKGQPNPELVRATKKGVSITPIRGKMPKDLKKCAFGAGPPVEVVAPVVRRMPAGIRDGRLDWDLRQREQESNRRAVASGVRPQFRPNFHT